MENILIGSTIPDLTGKTLEDLTTNQIGLLLYNADGRTAPVVAGNEVTNPQLLNARGIQFVKKKADGTFDASLVIPNKSTANRNYQAYVAGVAGVVKLGDNAATETALTVATEGEGCIRLTDLTNTYVVDNFPANVCVTKKTSETNLQYLTKVVAAINADVVASTLVTATLETNTGKYQIKLETKSSKIKLGVATQGLFESYQPITVTSRVTAVGSGEQMQAIEKELTVFKGNGNYYQDGDLYYKEPLKASLTANYNTLSITWTGVAQPTVSTTMAVASVNLLVCVPSADATLKDIYDTFITPPAYAPAV